MAICACQSDRAGGLHAAYNVAFGKEAVAVTDACVGLWIGIVEITLGGSAA